MNNSFVLSALDEILPDKKAIGDLREVLEDINRRHASIEIDDGEVSVPTDVAVVLVTKAFFKEYFDRVGFGTYKVMVSLGMPHQQKSGVLKAPYCFATLYYTDTSELITIDFHSDLR